MKIENSLVSILKQENGWVGMLKHVETIGRVCYASTDRIKNDSYKNFIKNVLLQNGHWAAFELGTVYLKVLKKDIVSSAIAMYIVENTKPFTRYNEDSKYYYITTNYRVVQQLLAKNNQVSDPIFLSYDSRLEQFFLNNLSDESEEFKKRITVCWNCSRAIANEFIRHRAFSPMQQSTRYCNFAKDKFENQVTFIIPENIKKIALDEYNVDLNANPQELENLGIKNKVINNKLKGWETGEGYYFEALKLGEKPEDARGLLPHDLKTILYQSAYLEDLYYVPDAPSPEKAGFFNLRSDLSAHPDARKLSIDLENLLKVN